MCLSVLCAGGSIKTKWVGALTFLWGGFDSLFTVDCVLDCKQKQLDVMCMRASVCVSLYVSLI
jgi:hypothetical protein